MKKNLVRAASMALFFGAGVAQGIPITYTESEPVNGVLGTPGAPGSVEFSSLLTISATADTSDVVEIVGGVFVIPLAVGTVTFSVDGFSGTNAEGIAVIDDQLAPSAGFQFPFPGFPNGQLVTFDSAFGTYDLTTAIGPITGPSSGPISSLSTLNTSEGTLVYQSAGDSTFTATTTATVGVPEPATLGLLGLGLAAVGFVRRRKKH